MACLQAGADWIGLNFHPRSPRFVTLASRGRDHGGPAFTSSAVGLFVNRPASEVADVAAALGLSAVQLHGNEPPEDLWALDHLWIIKAFRLGRAADVSAMSDYLVQAGDLGACPTPC